MKKVVLKLDIHDDKAKRKAMRIASVLPGLDSISFDIKQRSLTLTGDIDPVPIVEKLRKSFVTDVLSIAPVKQEPEEKKKTTKKKKPDSSNDTKKEDPEKDKPEESKKEQGGAPQKGKQDPNKKKERGPDHKQLVKALEPANPYYYYYNDYHRPHPRYGPWRSMEEDPNACVIC